MITITNNYFENALRIEENSFCHVVIENPSLYRRFLSDLDKSISDEEDCFGVKDDGKESALSSIAFLVKHPLFIDIDEKKLSTVIQKDIASQMNEEGIQGFKELLNQIENWITSISLEYDVPVSYNSSLSPAALLKAFSVSSSKYENGFVEEFIYQIKKVAMTYGKKLFIVLNAQDVFCPQELETIFQELMRHGIYLLLCSGRSPMSFAKSERIILLDKDLAELHLHVN